MSKSLLITQCLQNDFVKPICPHDPLPNSLHIGYEESTRLIGEIPTEGILMKLMTWAYGQDPGDLHIINIRDWHDENDPNQKKHLEQFGVHCLKETKGAEFVFENVRTKENELIVNATGLNDFVGTSLEEILNQYKGQRLKIGIIGVWTEAKVTYLAYDIASRYPEFEVAVCSSLTASSSTHMHFVSLDQLKKILGINIFSSVTEFAGFLKDDTPSLYKIGESEKFGTKLQFESNYQVTAEDKSLISHLFRNSKSVNFKVLDGGFSGNLVLKSSAIDLHGHEEVPSVLKIGPRNPIAKERESFEKVRDVLGNNAPSIVDYIESENRAGIKYRYASMFDEGVQTFQQYYGKEENVEKIKYFLDIIFKKQLGRFYKAATLEKINLFEYYDFSPKYAGSVKKKVETMIGIVGNDDNITVEGQQCYNLCKFYENDIEEINSGVVQSHYTSYLHGDLNGANIIIDAQDNVWLIDFFHTHRGHILKDLIKLENDILYIFMKINNMEEFNEACRLIDSLIHVDDLWHEFEYIYFKHPPIQKAFEIIRHLRSYYKDLVHSDRNPQQLLIGLLRYSVHTLSFDESNDWQKKLALYSSAKLAGLIKHHEESSRYLRIDYLMPVNGNIGLTILPGRRDWGRSLTDDISVIKENNIQNIVCLLAEDEFHFYGVSGLLGIYRENDFNVKHIGIIDQGVPTVQEMKELTFWIHNKVENNECVLLHCVGGLGRTGTVAACYLKEFHQMTAEEAIKSVRESRSSRAIETSVQEDFVKMYS